jgi:hypothetical protein
MKCALTADQKKVPPKILVRLGQVRLIGLVRLFRLVSLGQFSKEK